MSAEVITLLSLEVSVHLRPGVETQLHSLQQHAGWQGLLLGGVERLVVSGGGVPGSLPLPSLELPLKLVVVLAGGASGPRLHLPLAEGDAPGDVGRLGGLPGGHVCCFIASHVHVAGNPVESHPPPLRGETVHSGQDGGDEPHTIAGLQQLKDLQPCPGVGRAPGPAGWPPTPSAAWSSGHKSWHTARCSPSRQHHPSCHCQVLQNRRCNKQHR